MQFDKAGEPNSRILRRKERDSWRGSLRSFDLAKSALLRMTSVEFVARTYIALACFSARSPITGSLNIWL
jgi:hypothetical protein